MSDIKIPKPKLVKVVKMVGVPIPSNYNELAHLLKDKLKYKSVSDVIIKALENMALEVRP